MKMTRQDEISRLYAKQLEVEAEARKAANQSAEIKRFVENIQLELASTRKRWESVLANRERLKAENQVELQHHQDELRDLVSASRLEFEQFRNEKVSLGCIHSRLTLFFLGLGISEAEAQSSKCRSGDPKRDHRKSWSNLRGLKIKARANRLAALPTSCCPLTAAPRVAGSRRHGQTTRHHAFRRRKARAAGTSNRASFSASSISFSPSPQTLFSPSPCCVTSGIPSWGSRARRRSRTAPALRARQATTRRHFPAECRVRRLNAAAKGLSSTHPQEV